LVLMLAPAASASARQPAERSLSLSLFRGPPLLYFVEMVSRRDLIGKLVANKEMFLNKRNINVSISRARDYLLVIIWISGLL
jgi:hypothetical protein